MTLWQKNLAGCRPLIEPFFHCLAAMKDLSILCNALHGIVTHAI